MGRAVISNGTWTRNAVWEKDGVWRTDIFKTTLADTRLRYARYILKGGPIATIPVNELKRVLVGGSDRYDGGKIWGPFNLDPIAKTINEVKVEMQVEPQT